ELPAAQELAEIHAIHVLHEQVEEAVALAEVVHGDDVRMIQHGERLRLAGETLSKLRIALPLRREHLQSDETTERFLPRLVHHAHAAATEAFVDLEFREVRGNFLDRKRRAITGSDVSGHGGIGAE